MKRLLQFVIALLALASVAPAYAAEIKTTEYELKAAFLFNFTQFVEWPTNSFDSPSDPIVIGILGNDPFGDTLDKIVAGESVRGRKLEVQRFPRPSDFKKCHILFVSRSLSAQWGDILRDLRNTPILTVSDMERFAQRGGMIHLVTERNVVRLRINTDAVRRANISISSKLLRLADNVGDGGGMSP